MLAVWVNHRGHGEPGTKSRDQADAQACKETTGEKNGEGCCGSLKNHTKIKDPAGSNESPTTTDMITKQGRCEGAKERAGGENGHHSRRLGRRNIQVAFWVAVSCREGISPVVHSQNATNRSRVVAEENAAEGDKQPDQDGRPCRTGLGRGLDLDRRSGNGKLGLTERFHLEIRHCLAEKLVDNAGKEVAREWIELGGAMAKKSL